MILHLPIQAYPYVSQVSSSCIYYDSSIVRSFFELLVECNKSLDGLPNSSSTNENVDGPNSVLAGAAVVLSFDGVLSTYFIVVP